MPYLQPAQDEELHPPHPEPDDGEGVDPFPMPNFERRFSVSFDPQDGQTASGFWPKTSFSKQHVHLAH